MLKGQQVTQGVEDLKQRQRKEKARHKKGNYNRTKKGR